MRSNIRELELGYRSCLHRRHNSAPLGPSPSLVPGMWHQVLLPQHSAAGQAGTQRPPSHLDAVMVLPEQHTAVGADSRDQTFKAHKTPLPSSGNS